MRIVKFKSNPNGVYAELLGLVDTGKGMRARVEFTSGKRDIVRLEEFVVLQEEDFKPRKKRVNYNKLWYDKYGY